jgi:hypothetical protein
MPDEPYFEIASGKVLREKYGLTAENRPSIRLDVSRVPEELRCWIPLAERWGIGDDLIREDCIEKATAEELRELLEWQPDDGTLDAWLTGPESSGARVSEEYVAFTCLVMAYDSARITAKKREQR